MVDAREGLGPAEHIIKALTTLHDHMYHGRPGMVTPDPSRAVGVKWEPVTHKTEGDKKVVYKLHKGRPNTLAGDLWKDGTIRVGRRKVGEYRKPGLFPEVAVWMYEKIAEVWKLDNEFSARWASFAFADEHRDLKTVLAAFMLVQARKGDPEMEDGKVLFYDADYRDVGEAMVLLTRKDKRHLDAKYLKRIRQLLELPGVAKINRDLGFTRSARNPALGRWRKAVTKWLLYREQNLPMLEGLVKAGYKSTVISLAKQVGYKPQSQKFFEVLGWKQQQAKDGHRQIAIGEELAKEATWEGLTEEQICERIVAEKPNFKRLVGLVPKDVGMTRAVTAAAVESGCFSDKELVIHAPTLEELGLIPGVQSVREKLEAALKRQEDTRSANIAKRMKKQDLQDKLEAAAEETAQKVVAKAMRDIRLHFIVDISSSMQHAIKEAKQHINKLLPAFPENRVHVSIFNQIGRQLKIPHYSTKGIEAAFRGIYASGGTNYGAGVMALAEHKPSEEEDLLTIFVGDGCNFDRERGTPFQDAFRAAGLNPTALGFIHVGRRGYAVEETAAQMGIPCFLIDNQTFEDEAYGIIRTIRRLIETTPVGQRAVGRPAPKRVTLVDQILKTELLQKPVWAA